MLPTLYRLIRIYDTIALGPNVLLSFQSGCQSVKNTDMDKYKVTLNNHSGARKCAIPVVCVKIGKGYVFKHNYVN